MFNEWFVRVAIYIFCICDGWKDRVMYEMFDGHIPPWSDGDPGRNPRQERWDPVQKKWHFLKWVVFLGSCTILELHFVRVWWMILIDVVVARVLWRSFYCAKLKLDIWNTSLWKLFK